MTIRALCQHRIKVPSHRRMKNAYCTEVYLVAPESQWQIVGGTEVGSGKHTLEYLNDLLRTEFLDQYAAGWRVTTYTYYADVEEPHQIQVNKGGADAGGITWTAAGPSLEQALEVAMVMTRD